MDPKVSPEISSSAGDESELSTNATRSEQVDNINERDISIKEEKTPAASTSKSASNHGSGSSIVKGGETVSIKEKLVTNLYPRKVDKGRNSSAHANNTSGKRKLKVVSKSQRITLSCLGLLYERPFFLIRIKAVHL